MEDELLLTYLSSHRDLHPRRRQVLLGASVVLHVVVVSTLVVVPLTSVEDDLPELRSVATFLVKAPPPPPPPPPPPRTTGSAGRTKNPPRPLEARFVAPVTVPSVLPVEDYGASDFLVAGGVEGGVPGGVAGGIVGGLDEAPASEVEEPVRLDFRTEEAKPLVRVEPDYPDLAVEARVQGAVIVEVLVGPDGAPETINVLRTIPLLEAAALEAVRKWRWKPYVLLGKPVPFRVTVTVSFRLT
jgi:protein TonB